MIGTGIFLLPGSVAAMMGPAALVTYLISALLCTLLVLCFAEVGSRFRGTGGPMLYTLSAFGELPGFLVGWFIWLTRITAWGALANGMVSAATALWPAAHDYRVAIIVGLIATLAATNIAGVSLGARVTSFFTAAKLLPIAFFIAIGLFHIRRDLFTPFSPLGFTELAPTTLVILWAFVGFEILTVPAGEMRNPRRSVPRALVLTMLTVSVVARFAQYIPTCLAVLYFRKKRPDDPPGFRVGGGPVVPVLAVALCVWLLVESEPRRLFWGLAGLVAGLLIYGIMRLLRGRALADPS